jgi:hypothetical protein
MKYLSILLLSVLFLNCENENSEPTSKALTANEIINESIAVSVGKVFDSAVVSINFDFRNIQYKSTYTSNTKVLRRLTINDNDTILDFLKGERFQRYINEKPVFVEDSMAIKYSASVNSVHYFSVLPYGLNDKAVNKKLIGEERIKGKDYYKIEVTFSQEGGGEDFEDVFIYWINKASFKPDYLAYSYNEDDGKGMRFREAYNERYVNDLRFVDYNNYKSEDKKFYLIDLAKAFNNNSLKLLSKIELQNVEVDLINN